MRRLKTLRVVVLVAFALVVFPSFDAAGDSGEGNPFAVAGYLRVPGVNGSSKDPAHLGWIELKTFSFEQGRACFSVSSATYKIVPGTSASGEAKLKQMCRARTPIAGMRVDVAGGPHVLNNVVFVNCMDGGNSNGDVESIRYANCSLHHKPPPSASTLPTQHERPSR